MQKKTIHRYEVIEKIGEGGMGFVYKARDPRIDRIVAIKTIKFGTTDDIYDVEEKKKRFYREAKTSGKLFHQNIVTILDVDEYEDFSYIVMEYVEGETLARQLRGGQAIDVHSAVFIVSQVCNAIHYAHGVGIIHRDIKPSNIMIIGDNIVKVADFGLAKMLSSHSANITKTGGVVGTPFYMAPEQIRGETTDARIDIFATGVVLYECLTGAKPFIGDSISTIIYKILHEKPVCIREFNTSLSPRLDSIVQKALAKNKEDRYQTAAEMSIALKKFLAQDKAIRDRTAAMDQTPVSEIEQLQGNVTYSIDALPVEVSDTPSKQVQDKAVISDISHAQPVAKTIVVPSQEKHPEPKPKKKKFRILSILGFLIFLIMVGRIFFLPFHEKNSNKKISPSAVMVKPSVTAITELSSNNISKQVPSPTSFPVISQNSEISPLPTFEETFPVSVKEAFVHITADPADAMIYLDSNSLGKSPIEKKLKEGKYTFEAKLNGFKAANQTIEVNGSEENPTIVNLILKPQLAILNVTILPMNAKIYLDNKLLGSSPIKNVKIIAGKYTLSIKRKNYKSENIKLFLKPGEAKKISKELKAAGNGSLSINAIPWANIVIDGKEYQSTPLTIPKISSGIHKIKLFNKNFPTFETVIEVPLGKNVKINHDFATYSFGVIQANAIPYGNVFIDGKLEGETPISKKVSVGKHKILISLTGHNDQIFNITVGPAETKRIKAMFNEN